MKNKIILYIVIIYFINVINIIIYLFIADHGPTIKNLTIPFLVVFPVVILIFTLLYLFNIDYNQLIKKNKLHKKILKSAVDTNISYGYITLNNKYEYILFNKTHEKYVNETFNKAIKIGDNYLSTYKDIGLKESIKINIDNAFLGLSSEKTFNLKNYVVRQRYNPIFDKTKVIAVNIVSKDLTKEYLFEKEMKELTYIDTLTGLSNRNLFEKNIIEYNDKNISAIYIDIDGLKFMNDAFGHDEGDNLILTVANEIKNVVSKKDSIFRLGGDEFIILLKNKNYNETRLIANKIQNNLDGKKINDLDVSVSIGFSIGNENERVKDTIIKAEKKMYDNKIIFNKRHPHRNIDNIMAILKRKDKLLDKHIEDVVLLTNKVGKLLNLDDYNLEMLKSLSKLHDIGKISFDSNLLHKDINNLTEDEVNTYRSHIDTGYRILSRMPKYFDIAFDLLCQYENYDGTGYPKGIRGKNIPIKARILRVCNYYDYLIKYQKLSKDKTLNILKDERGKALDPKIVDSLIKVI